jgi:hypothetical protein
MAGRRFYAIPQCWGPLSKLFEVEVIYLLKGIDLEAMPPRKRLRKIRDAPPSKNAEITAPNFIFHWAGIETSIPLFSSRGSFLNNLQRSQ